MTSPIARLEGQPANPVQPMREGKDPVCGMTVDLDHPKGGKLVHEGREFGFCSPACLARFKADPARYLTPQSAAPEVAATRAEYTCPMHPEIIRPSPGACPICGMALEPRTVSTEEDNQIGRASCRERV